MHGVADETLLTQYLSSELHGVKYYFEMTANTFRSLKCSPAFLFKYYTHLNVSVVSLITQDGLDIVIALNIIPYIFMWLVWHACMRINKRRGRHTK